MRVSLGQGGGSSRGALAFVPAICIMFLGSMLGACATSGAAQGRAALLELLTGLPGLYDNSQQAAAAPSMVAVQVSVQPAYAPALGKQVFYIQENAADDPRRIISARLVAFDADPHGGVLQRDWVFTDPMRWRTARAEPDLFKGLILGDVREVPARKVQRTSGMLTLQINAGAASPVLELRAAAP